MPSRVIGCSSSSTTSCGSSNASLTEHLWGHIQRWFAYETVLYHLPDGGKRVSIR